MKWPFLNKLRFGGSTGTKFDGKKRSRRPEKARIVDLMCTIRRRTNLHGSKYCDLDSIESMESYCAPRRAVDLPDKFNSRPRLLACSWSGWSAQQMLTYFGCPAAGCMNRDCSSQSAFCPTCRNLAIPMPQKRHSVQAPTNYPVVSTSGERNPKRIRICSELPCLPRFDCSPFPYEPLKTAAEYFNPAYDSLHSVSEETIYCSVADDMELKDSSVSLVPPRPKLIATRRRVNHYVGMADLKFQRWLIDDTSAESQIHLPSNEYSTIALYDTTPDEAFGEPWLSSTLRRPRTSCFDTETLYDEVASDHENEVVPRGKDRLRLRRQLTEGHDHPVPAQIKRLRREFFVCEE